MAARHAHVLFVRKIEGRDGLAGSNMENIPTQGKYDTLPSL
jgi:hypothetical protein